MAPPSLSATPDRGNDPTDIARLELELEAAIRRGDVDAAKALTWEFGVLATRAAHLAKRQKAGLRSGEVRRALSDKKRRRWLEIAEPYRQRHPDHSTADVARYVASEVERLNLDCRAELDTIRKAIGKEEVRAEALRGTPCSAPWEDVRNVPRSAPEGRASGDGTASRQIVGSEHCSRPCTPNAGPACCEQSNPEAP